MPGEATEVRLNAGEPAGEGSPVPTALWEAGANMVRLMGRAFAISTRSSAQRASGFSERPGRAGTASAALGRGGKQGRGVAFSSISSVELPKTQKKVTVQIGCQQTRPRSRSGRRLRGALCFRFVRSPGLPAWPAWGPRRP